MSRDLELIIEGLRAIREDLEELIEELDASERKRNAPDSLVPYSKSRQAQIDAGVSDKDFK
jgi:hypothetical protein